MKMISAIFVTRSALRVQPTPQITRHKQPIEIISVTSATVYT